MRFAKTLFYLSRSIPGNDGLARPCKGDGRSIEQDFEDSSLLGLLHQPLPEPGGPRKSAKVPAIHAAHFEHTPALSRIETAAPSTSKNFV